MSTAITVVLAYLGFDPLKDFIASEKDGEIVVVWNIDNPPTKDQIDAATLPAARYFKIRQINTDAARRILSVYPLEKQSSANLGIYPQAYTDKMIADIASMIAASNTACDAVDAAVDVAGVDAVVVNWPVIGA